MGDMDDWLYSTDFNSNMFSKYFIFTYKKEDRKMGILACISKSSVMGYLRILLQRVDIFFSEPNIPLFIYKKSQRTLELTRS